jgi:hypothetical protein
MIVAKIYFLTRRAQQKILFVDFYVCQTRRGGKVLVASVEKSQTDRRKKLFQGRSMISIVYGSPVASSPNNWAAIVG